VWFTVTRSDGTAGAVSVDWTTGTYSGSATAGTNFFDTITASTATTTVHELAGSAVISFVRTGSGSGPAGIQILSDPRTALPVIQYGSPSASSLTWADGELGPKSLTLPIVHDGVASGNTSMSITAGIAYGLRQCGCLGEPAQHHRDHPGRRWTCPQWRRNIIRCKQ